MRRSVPVDLKQSIVRLSSPRLGLTRPQIRALTGVAESSQRRILALYNRTGDVEGKSWNRGRPTKLHGLALAFLEGCIERTTDISLRELRKELFEVHHILVSEATIWRVLRRRGLTMKQLTRPALERDEVERTHFKIHMAQYRPDQLVFVDESHYNRLTMRRRLGWSPRGTRARRRDFFIRGKRYSMLPALSLDGILGLNVVKGAITQELFFDFVNYIATKMNPFPQPRSVLVMDNASIHHIDGLREHLEARGIRLEYLPPYSPDLNPIEEAFSSIKASIRSNRDYVLAEIGSDPNSDPYEIIWKAVYTVTPAKARGWFRHSGYIGAIYH